MKHAPTPRRSLAAIAALTAALMTGMASPAMAADPPPAPAPPNARYDIDVTAPKDRLPIDAAAQAKIHDSLTSYFAAPGRGVAEIASARQQLARNDALLSAGGGSYADAARVSIAPAVAAAAPTSRTLAYTYAAQLYNNYCGPATALMLIRQNGIGNSLDGYNLPLTQSNLATFAYLQTDYYNATTWASQRMQYGLQGWMNFAGWGYVQVQSPTAATVTGALTRVIGTNGKAFAADTVEYINGAHYNNHPSEKLIGHWVMAYGYASSGGTSYWADPSIYFFTSAAKTFSYNTSTFTNTFLQSNGVLY